MNKKYLLLLAFAGGIAVTLIVPIVVIGLGIINFAADVPAGPIERTLGHWAFERSMAVRAPDGVQIQGDDPTALASGLAHYRENCLMCHGAPEVEPAELAKGLNPPAPKLGSTALDMSDGELFWVVKHGIRMTAMPAFGPTHDDQELGSIVAFLRHLPDLTVEERRSLLGNGNSEDIHHSTRQDPSPAQTQAESSHHHSGR